MRDGSISILLVGENLQRCPELHRWLDNQRLRCECAASYQGACSRIPRRQFGLVISEYQLPDRTAFPLLDLLAGSPATLFFFTGSRERLFVAAHARPRATVHRRPDRSVKQPPRCPRQRFVHHRDYTAARRPCG